jgi:hypothetical protein
MPNSNNAITITASAGERGPEGYNGGTGIVGPIGPVGDIGANGGDDYDRLEVTFRDRQAPYIRTDGGDAEKTIGYVIFSTTIDVNSIKVIMAGQYALAKVSVYNSSGVVIALSYLSLSDDMQVFDINPIGAFPQVNELLKITVRTQLKAGYPTGTDHRGDLAYFEIT